jgi:hypothetical protein
MAATIESIAARLYATPPSDILFHYTSIGVLQPILRDRSLWATDIRFFSDAAELKHLMHGLHAAIRTRTPDERLTQFSNWLADRLPHGNMIFAVSFSTQGDLLSQWRAYSPAAKGISLGFDPVWSC